MPRWVVVLLAALSGFVLGAVIGYLLVDLLSKNRHDKPLEAAMTALFFSGPLGAGVGVVAGLLWNR